MAVVAMAMYGAKVVQADSVSDAAKAIAAIDVSGECVRIMQDKAVFRLVKLHGVRNAVANIIKQEMLSCGGDATVSQWTVNCSRPKTDVLLMGTLQQYRRLIIKMRMQAANFESEAKREEYKAVSGELSAALAKDIRDLAEPNANGQSRAEAKYSSLAK